MLARVAGSLRGLESDRGDFADLRSVIVGHAVEKERSVSGVGVLIMGPCSPDGSGGYPGGQAPVCRPCLGDSACGQLEGGGGVC